MGSEQYLLPQFKHLHKEYDAVVQCNRCGFCETVCPTYVVSGKETLSPRGRNQAFRSILEGKAPASDSAKIFTTCLTCHACTNVCFSQVPVGRLMAHARSVSLETNAKSGVERRLLRLILPRRRLMSALMRFGFILKMLGVSAALRKLGLLEKISPELASADELVGRVPLRFGARVPPDKAGASGPRVAAFSGCGIHYLYPRAAQAAVDVLSSAGARVACASNDCCGLPSSSAGDMEGARALARRNIRKFSKLDAVVVDDDSCGGFMKTYGELLEGDLQAVAFSAKVKSLAEFLKEMNYRPPQKAPAGKTRVTYHDPCQMGNGQHQFDPPRRLLKDAPEVEFVELPESNWCCGGAGTYCLKHPVLADDVLERKLENVRSTGADVLVTQASSCLIHMEYGIRKKGWGKEIRVMHLAEFLKRMGELG